MKNNIFKNILCFQPKVYGLIYLGLIPFFALIYWFIPFLDFKTELLIDNYLTCLYYSTVTITTLGFGDISPISQLAQIVTMSESILGLVIIGLFLNSVAHLKSTLDVAEEKIKNQEKAYLREQIRLKRHNKIIQTNIVFYLRYTTIVTSPIRNRAKGILNKDFVFNDLKDLFKSTTLMTDNFFEPAINYYFKHQHSLEKSIHEMLLNVDFSYWPELETLCFSFLDKCKELDYSTYILNQPNTRLGEKKGSDSDAEMIEKHTGEVNFLYSNSINAYVALYYLIKANINFVDNYQIEIEKINMNK